MDASSIQRIHLERDDPVAPGRTQVWRGWTQLTEPGKGSVFVEEGHFGQCLRVTEHGQESMGCDPVEFLGKMILSRGADERWEISLLSSEARYSTRSRGRRLFQFSPPTKSGAPELARFLVSAIRDCEDVGGQSSIDWLTRPRTWDEDLVPGFRAPVQVGLDMIEIRVKGDHKAVVLSADIEIGSAADTLLLMIAACSGLPGRVAIADEQGVTVDPMQHLRALPSNTPDWLEEFGCERGVVTRKPRLKTRQSKSGFVFV